VREPDKLPQKSLHMLSVSSQETLKVPIFFIQNILLKVKVTKYQRRVLFFCSKSGKAQQAVARLNSSYFPREITAWSTPVTDNSFP